MYLWQCIVLVQIYIYKVIYIFITQVVKSLCLSLFTLLITNTKL